MNINQEAQALANEDEATPIELLNRFDEPATYGPDDAPVTIRVVGQNSKAQNKAAAWQRKQQIALGGRKATPQQERAFWCGYLARCCVGWEGFFDDAGQPLPFSVENCTDALTKLPWLERQVSAALGNSERYRPATATP
jgi:hypothetical protein